MKKISPGAIHARMNDRVRASIGRVRKANNALAPKHRKRIPAIDKRRAMEVRHEEFNTVCFAGTVSHNDRNDDHQRSAPPACAIDWRKPCCQSKRQRDACGECPYLALFIAASNNKGHRNKNVDGRNPVATPSAAAAGKIATGFPVFSEPAQITDQRGEERPRWYRSKPPSRETMQAAKTREHQSCQHCGRGVRNHARARA